MQQFFSSFSSSFLFALLLWPFLAVLLTLPILVIQYRRYNTFYFWRAVMTYTFVLYGLALVSFTLYPMPDDPVQFCADYHLVPQLVPFTSIMELSSEGMRAVLQVGMNVVFFIPLGLFGRLLFRWHIGRTILLGFIVSFSIETAQLTGAFGLYPCSYRLFDVDDIILNTLGAIIGYLLAMVVPRRELRLANKSDIVRQAGLLRYTVAFIIDQIVATMCSVFVLLLLYQVLGSTLPVELGKWVRIATLCIVYMVIPLLCHGWSIGGKMVRLNYDDKGRSFWRRLLFYLLRIACILLVLVVHNGWTTFALLVAGAICWRIWKKLPYQLI